MQQPQLGKKISELRKQKGLTQEELAEQCYINIRSIQRIEVGEVIPRLSTLRILSEVLKFELNGNDHQSLNLWILFLHLSNLIQIVIPALIVWVWKKNEIPELELHGKAVLNFQKTMYLCLLFSVPIMIPLPFIGLFIYTVTIINIIRIAQDKSYTYPVSIKFLKPS
jgi:transcriptional regulator with XRE-family HTH domain